MTANNWDIWLVDMPFEESIGSKVRPGLVIESDGAYYIVGKMTTHPPRNHYPYEYALKDWRGAGLNFPTTLRLSHRVRLDRSKFIKKLGVVQPIDMIAIYRMLVEIENAESR